MNDDRSSSLSRREFLQITSAGAAAVAGQNAISAPPSTTKSDRRSEYGQPLQEFQHGQIEFQPGLHEAQLEQAHSVLMKIDENSLLWPFRHLAGLPTPGCSLLGWYQVGLGNHGLIFFSELISALARYYAITQDEPTRAKVERLIGEFSRTIEPSGKLFAGINADQYGRLVRALVDAHHLTQNPIALDVLSRATDAVIPHLPEKVGRTTVGGWTLLLPEAQFIAWQHTGRALHLKLATKYLDHEFFDPLARGENCLANKNALAHMNALNSAAKAYLVLGEERYLRAAKNGFAFVEAQSYATGGWGPNECFLPSSMPFGEPGFPEGWFPEIKTLGDSLTCTHHHFETPAGAEAHFNVARYLLRITKETTYGDSIERVMYNTVLGALPPQESGMAFYNSNYHNDGRKTYFDNYGIFGQIGPEWIQEGVLLPQVAADYRINTYLRDDHGVYVNLFIPSTLRWRQNESQVSLTQTGAYPLGDKVTFTLTTSKPLEFILRLRIPAWADRPSISVNGKRMATVVKPGTFASLKQEWRSGDRIELELPRKLVLQAVDADHPDLVALVYGPLVLFAVTTETPRFTRQQLLSAERTSAEGHEWRVKVAGRSVRFVPFWVIKYERYSTYLQV